MLNQDPQTPEIIIPNRGPADRRPSDISEDSVLLDLFKNNKLLNFDRTNGFHGGPSARRKGYKLAIWSLLAACIDTLILISATSISILTFSFIVKASFGTLLNDVLHHQNKALLFGQVFFVCSWLYMISLRGLIGATIGEWSCDLRLGQPHERLQSGYILRVILRSTIIFLSGIVVLPLISLLIAKDMAGIASDLKLFSLK